MSCNRCADQSEAAMRAVGVPARQTQATWAGDEQHPQCPACGAFLTRQGQCVSSRCSAPQDYVIGPDDRLDAGGTKTKYTRNVAAIRLLKRLEAEDRPATPDE